nr:hypothetical protein [Shigella sonnei]
MGVLIASNYLGGYTALRYSSVDMSLLKWDTFHSVISTFLATPQYKKLVFMAWFGFSVPLIFFAIFMLIVVIGIMPKKVIYGDARLATDMDLSKSGFFPDKKSPYNIHQYSSVKCSRGDTKNNYLFRRTTIFNSLCPDTFW